MNRKLLFALLLSICCLVAHAQIQDLVSASGATFNSSTGSISYSIGEPITMTHSTSSVVLTQGFLQSILHSGVPVVNKATIHMIVYPNPVSDLLTLQIEHPEGFDYFLYDSKGGLINTGKVLDEHMEIDFSGLAPAIYILKVTNSNKVSRLFQIVKY